MKELLKMLAREILLPIAVATINDVATKKLSPKPQVRPTAAS